ncbi:hypothetical protein CRM22_005272 [Opisthorchis felineus]|uniref:BTB domain-containing protein n=1 Tax=Opisthorchis felineus TaxID=147828 RepID=A0A4S2LXR9_OPIFE|nr:hypothetical protein CRM22_005272 [Opisthorchis felineus]
MTDSSETASNPISQVSMDDRTNETRGRAKNPHLQTSQSGTVTFDKSQPHYRDLRRRSSSLHPKRLLRSLSSAFVSQPNTGGRSTGYHIERQRRYGVWHPVHYLVSSAQSKLKQHPPLKSFVSHQKPKHPVTGEYHGRFFIGHPNGCSAKIMDSPEESSSLQNSSSKTGQTFVETRESDSDSTNQNDSWRSKPDSDGRSVTFMNSDLIRCLCILPPDQPVIVRINVSGVRFHVLSTTLQRDPYVYSKFMEDAIWLPEQREYFVERDPEVFRFIHNYLRHGEVHLPCGICGPLLEKELDDWGLPLGLDIQRCCLGPVMNTKFKLESLQQFENKLQPKYVKPNSWIRSPRWQNFRAKVWSALAVIPKFNTGAKPRRSVNVTDSYTFFKEGERGSNVDEADIEQFTDFRNTDNVRQSGSSNKTYTVSFASSPHPTVHSVSDLSQEEESWVRWFRRTYIVCETLTVIAAVIVFMLSTCKEFREPIIQTLPSTHFNATTKEPNQKKFALPILPLISMDIGFTVLITIDILARMIFCPAIRPWLFSLQTMIDVMSVIPFYCEFILRELIRQKATMETNGTLGTLIKAEEYIVVLKVFVVLRLFRIVRRHRSSIVLLYTIRTTLVDLTIIVGLILGFALFFGALIYFIDESFHDIPRGFWWALITMSTVGYGDLVPSKAFGYGIATVCVLTGTLLMSYTIPILVNNFLLYYEHAEQLYMIRRVHCTAKHKAGRRTLSKYAQKALASAKGLVNATLTKSSAKGSANQMQVFQSKVSEVKELDDSRTTQQTDRSVPPQ